MKLKQITPLVDIVILTIIFISAFLIWTLPIQNDSRPFGEADSAWHFAIGDNIAQTDDPAFRLPFHVGQWYYGYNSILGPYAPEYPPPNHYNYALVQVIGGERFEPILIYRAIASFLGALAIYFLMRKLYNTAVATVAATALIFSFREIQIYLWGQQPTLVAIVITPITLYAFYRYLTSYFNKSSKVVYLYITVLLLVSQFLLHIQGFMLSVLIMGIFALFMTLKYKRIPAIKERYTHLIGAALVFIILAAPFVLIYMGAPDTSGKVERDFSRLTTWNVEHSYVSGSFPPAFVTFSHEYSIIQPPLIGGVWFAILLILLGLAYSLLRRRPQDLLMLAWFVAMYLSLHIDVFLGLGYDRAARMGVAEPALFFSLMAIGATSIVTFIPTSRDVKVYARIAIAAILILILISNGYTQTTNNLNGAYSSIFRITPEQTELAGWLSENTPENAYIFYVPYGSEINVGQWQYPKLRWILAQSSRYVTNYATGISIEENAPGSPIYFIFDYTDIVILANQPNPWQALANQEGLEMQQLQAQFNNTEPVYEKGLISVYEVPPEAIQ